MKLDFSALENITLQAIKKPSSPPRRYEEENRPPTQIKPVTGQNRAPREHTYTTLEKAKQERAQMREMYHTYQENIRRAGTLRSQILKGIQRKEDPLALLAKATQCIGYMTGDTVIYNQSKEDILAVYGVDLEDAQPRPQSSSNNEEAGTVKAS